MSDTNKMMVKIRFEGKKLADCDFWTKSDPYLLICRPSRTGKGLIHVSYFSYSIVNTKKTLISFLVTESFSISDSLEQ